MTSTENATGMPGNDGGPPEERHERPRSAPWAALLALMLGPFAFSTGAFVFGGLLEPMAAELGVTVNAVAQLQAVFAIACAIGGPALALLLGAWDRRRSLIGVLIFLAVINAASALATGYAGLFAIRLLGGFVGALTVPLASALAIGLVGPERRGQALALVLGGTSLAFLLGIPGGSLVGGLFGWQAAFWLAALICAVTAGLTLAMVPVSRDGPAPQKSDGRRAVALPVLALYGATLLGFSATFATVGLIGPLITALTGLTGAAVGAMQILVGIGGVAGLALGAWLADTRGVRSLPVLFAVIAASQCIYLLALWFPVSGSTGLVLFALATVPGAGALFATSPVVAATLAGRAGPAATLAFALNGATIFLGQGAGVALGGLGLGLGGLVGAAGIAVVLALLGIAYALRLARNPSPPPGDT